MAGTPTTAKLIRFTGNWDYRLRGLFEAGVSYAGKRILDAGCNSGIIAYEIGKHRPALMHGVDVSEPQIMVAKVIFLGYEFPSRFDALNLADEAAMRATLLPEYDIVLLLSVWRHIRDKYGMETAKRAVRILAERCAQTFLTRASFLHEPEMRGTIESLGFHLGLHDAKNGTVVFRRSGVEPDRERIAHPPPPVFHRDMIHKPPR